MSAKNFTKDELRAALRALHEKGEALNTKSMRAKYRSLYCRGLKLHTTWKATIEDLGLDYAEVTKRKYLGPRKARTRDECLAGIRERARLGLSLQAGICSQEIGWLTAAVSQYFDSWDEFLRTAGFDPDVVRGRRVSMNWTKEELIEILRTRYREGLPINSEAIAQEDIRLPYAFKNCFDNYRSALIEAGFDPDAVYVSRPSMTRDEIIEEFQRRHRAGLPLNYQTLADEGAGRLLMSIRTACMTYREAIEASGFDYDAIRRTEAWSEEKVIARIKEIADRGEPLNAAYIVVRYKTLYNAACHHCGSWEQAVEKAGFVYDRIIQKWYFHRRSSSLKPFRAPQKK